MGRVGVGGSGRGGSGVEMSVLRHLPPLLLFPYLSHPKKKKFQGGYGFQGMGIILSIRMGDFRLLFFYWWVCLVMCFQRSLTVLFLWDGVVNVGDVGMGWWVREGGIGSLICGDGCYCRR